MNKVGGIKRVFFLTGEWSGLRRFVRGQVGFPEGMPSVYLPWLAYKKRGYDVHVFMIGGFKRKGTLLFQQCMIHLVPRSLLSRALLKLIGKNLGGLLSLACQNLRLYRYAARAGRRLPPTVIYTQRPMHIWAAWFFSKRYHCCSIKRIYGTHLHDELITGTRTRSRIEHILEKRAWRRPANMIIITNDGSEGDKVAELLGIEKSHYRLWFNGVHKTWTGASEESESLRVKSGLSKEHFVLLCLGRLESWKRQDRVVRAMPSIIHELPNARLVLAGDGPFREYLSRLVADLGLASFVQFLGMVPHNQVPIVMGIADVFLQTNDRANLCNTLLEAVVCGRTIVACDIGGAREVIRDNETGRLLPDPEPATIAQAVIDLAKNPEKAKRLGHNARRFAEENLQSWDERLDMEIDLVESLCH